MTSFTNTTLNYPQNANTPIKRVKTTRNPTSTDNQNFILGDEWLNTTTQRWWKLCNITASTAKWVPFPENITGAIETITGDSGGAVPPTLSTGNLNLLGTAGQITVTGNTSTNTLTLSLAGGGTAIDSITVDAATAPGTNPVAPNGSGAITITGAQVATGTIGANVIRTDSLAANSLTVEVQRSTSAAATDSTKNGVAHFNSAMFSVDSSGFVSLTGGGEAIDTLHPSHGIDVAPTGAGLVNFPDGNGIKTTGTANTLTVDMNSPFTGNFTFTGNLTVTENGGGGAVVSTTTYNSAVSNTRVASLVNILGSAWYTAGQWDGAATFKQWIFGMPPDGGSAPNNSFVLGYSTGNGDPTGGTRTLVATTTGVITEPAQPAFFGYLATTATNKTGNGASYTLGTDALTKVYDQGTGYFTTAGVFTAPVAGIYDLRSQITITGTTIATSFVISIVVSGTSARTYTNTSTRAAASTDQSVSISALAKMSATDTATVTIVATGEAADTDDILGAASAQTYFCGTLAC